MALDIKGFSCLPSLQAQAGTGQIFERVWFQILTQISIHEPTLFLILTNDLLDVLFFGLGIYAANTIIYSCLSRKSDRSVKVNLVTALTQDL